METQSRNFPLNADLLFTENSMKLFVSPKWFVHPGIEPGSLMANPPIYLHLIFCQIPV